MYIHSFFFRLVENLIVQAAPAVPHSVDTQQVAVLIAATLGFQPFGNFSPHRVLGRTTDAATVVRAASSALCQRQSLLVH